jgi:hypothetical protein
MHDLQALVADISVLHEFAAEYKNAVVINLGEQSMGLLPLTQTFLDEFDNSELPYPKMIKLSKPLLEKVVVLSKLASIAYIQTEYWGGTGTQGAMVWHSGEVVLEPVLVDGIGAINTALQKLGVKAVDTKDEFDTLGLGKFRNTSQWIKLSE